MTSHPIGFGNDPARQRFLQSHQQFLQELPVLDALLTKVSCQALAALPQCEADCRSNLPQDDPAVIECEDKVMVDRVVFGLGRIMAEDFREIFILTANGFGIGAYKILRGMYERLVTAVYMAKNPAEARPFLEDDAIKRCKLWQQGLEVMPDLKDSIPKKTVDALEAESNRIKGRRRESLCKTCGQPKTQEAWTRVDLASMARRADHNLSKTYGACYLMPTFHSHATGFGLAARFVRNEKGELSFRETSEDEASVALQLAHVLMLRHLGLQDEYFSLGLKQEIQQRMDAFERLWASS